MNGPAVRFFALIKAGRKIKAEQQALAMLQLCDVSSIALGDSQYYKQVRDGFMDRALGKPIKASPALDPTDPKTVELLNDLFLQASRLS